MQKGYKSLKIKNIDDVSSTLQRIANLVFNGEMDNATARCLTDIIRCRIAVAKQIELEERLEMLEDLLQSKENL